MAPIPKHRLRSIRANRVTAALPNALGRRRATRRGRVCRRGRVGGWGHVCPAPMTSAISSAICSMVNSDVLRAILSASEGLSRMTSSFVRRCQRGRIVCSPVISIVTSPSSSYCGHFFAKNEGERTTMPNLLRARPRSILRRRLSPILSSLTRHTRLSVRLPLTRWQGDLRPHPYLPWHEKQKRRSSPSTHYYWTPVGPVVAEGIAVLCDIRGVVTVLREA